MTSNQSAESAQIEAVVRALGEHTSSGVTTVVDERAQRITGTRAWCYCGGYTPGRDAKWRGSFNVPSEQADRELREHLAEAVLAELVARPE